MVNSGDNDDNDDEATHLLCQQTKTMANNAKSKRIGFSLVLYLIELNSCRTVFGIYFNTVLICSVLFQLANAIHFTTFRIRSNRSAWIKQLKAQSIRMRDGVSEWMSVQQNICWKSFGAKFCHWVGVWASVRVCHLMIMLHLPQKYACSSECFVNFFLFVTVSASASVWLRQYKHGHQSPALALAV